MLCFCLMGGERPLEFVASPGSGHALERLSRSSETELLTLKHGPEESGANELARLEGEWAMIYGEHDGAMFPEGFIESGKRSQVSDLVTVSVGGQVILKATISVDASTKSNSTNYSILTGPNKGKQQHGIYEIYGNMLRVRFANPGKDRPTQFTTLEGDERTFTVWKRVMS